MFEKLKCAIKREVYLPKLIQRGLKVGKNFKMMGGCIIDSAHCWHISIGDDVIVGAGSIVSKDIPSGMLAVGNPAKVICSVEEYVDRINGEINSENTFGEGYTLRNSNFSQEQRNRMVEVASKQKLIFVK